MKDILELVTAKRVVLGLGKCDKEGAILRLSQVLADDLAGVPAELISQSLLGRERLSSTGIGGGLAIPHGRLHEIKRPLAAIGRCRQGIDFAARDGEPVHLVVALISPLEDQAAHLHALSTLSRFFRHAAVRDVLLAAASVTEMMRILSGEELQP